MWERFGQRGTRRSKGLKSRLGALEKVRGRFGRREPQQAQLTYGGAVGLGVGALALVGGISLLVFMWRRSRGSGSATEEVNEETNAENEESTG
jgi:hypothetical protein